MKKFLPYCLAILLAFTFTAALGMAESLEAASDMHMEDGGTGRMITMTVGDIVINIALDEGPIADDLLSRLPMTLDMARWGDREYYAAINPQLVTEGDAQDGFTPGDVGYWLPGPSFAIFFNEGISGSLNDFVVIGHITSDLAAFGELGENVEAVFAVAE